jgi:putative transposase
MMIPLRPDERWSLDFVADQMTGGRRFRMRAIVDDCTRECLALVADTSLSGVRVARELDRLLAERGRPKMIVSDNVLCREAALGFGQQVSSRWQCADVGNKLIQMVSTVNGIAPSHSKHRIQRH